MGRSQPAPQRTAYDASARKKLNFNVLARFGGIAGALILTLGGTTAPASAGVLQCVPYAREVSGIDLRGNASTWWNQAAGIYERGQEPRVGAVLAFRATSAMRFGHVAVVREIVDSRHVILNHANWSGRGGIERSALAEDVSAAGDWSTVRVWFARTASLGIRTNPTYGFIYASSPSAPATDTIASGAQTTSIAFAEAFAPYGAKLAMARR